MQVAGNLAVGLRRRLVAERQSPDAQGRGEGPADPVGRIGVVVAGDPQPVASALQRGERRAIRRRKPRRPLAVVETVAQRHDDARRMAGDQSREPRQRCGRVVGRQQHAARGEARAFFQVEVGDDQQAFLGPVERPGQWSARRLRTPARVFGVQNGASWKRRTSVSFPESACVPPYAIASCRAKPPGGFFLGRRRVRTARVLLFAPDDRPGGMIIRAAIEPLHPPLQARRRQLGDAPWPPRSASPAMPGGWRCRSPRSGLRA